MAILVVEKSFQFYKFIRCTKENEVSNLCIPEFDFVREDLRISISPCRCTSSSTSQTQPAALQIRSTSELLYFAFLKSYNEGLQAQYIRAVNQDKSRGRAGQPRSEELVKSINKWAQALNLAKMALENATRAWSRYKNDNNDDRDWEWAEDEDEDTESQRMAKIAVKLLDQR